MAILNHKKSLIFIYIAGIQSHGCMHPCYLCDGYRVDMVTGMKTSKGGFFVKGELRSPIKNSADHNGWSVATSGLTTKAARLELRHHNSVHALPILLNGNVDVPYLVTHPPDPLHCIRFLSLTFQSKMIILPFGEDFFLICMTESMKKICRIGLVNDVLSILEDRYPCVIKEFLEMLSLERERGRQPGLMFSGKQLEKILKNTSDLHR